MKITRTFKSRGLLAAVTCVLTAWLWVANAPAQSDNVVHVNSGESVAITVTTAPRTLAVADPTIADAIPLSKSEINVIGKKVGVTTLTIVYEDKPTQVFRIEVSNDMTAMLIRKVVNAPNVTVRNVGDTVILDGFVNDEIDAQRVAQVAGAYKGQQVINLIEVRNPRQIRVRTRVAEVNSEALKNIGFRWFGSAGEVQYALDYTGGGSILHGLVQPASSGTTPSDPISLDIGADVILQLLITKSYARLLSEPTLTTLSGKEASFLVGQEVPIVQQLPQSFTVEFKEVGVRMKIKPTSDSQNQISTVIQAEVSQVVGVGSLGIPIIGSKKAETTLQVKDGQTIVIGGLLENNINRDFLRKVPWLAEIPIFGALFRQKEFNQQQREVLFFMTVELVKNAEVDVANAARTPLMQQWTEGGADSKVLEGPKKGYDWGIHRPDRLGLPERKKSNVKIVDATPVQAAAPAPATSAATTAPKEPITNFTPARPAGE